MTKDEMIAYLMEELGGSANNESIYDVADHFYKKWLQTQDVSVVEQIYSGNKDYWEFP